MEEARNISVKDKRDWDLLFLLLTILVGLLCRWLVLHVTNFGIESDEAVVGLMAKHITEGRPWPVFYYGQPYMGSLEAICAALSFTVFGRSNLALKIVPLIFSLIQIWLVYRLARQVTDRYGARIAALLTAIGPSTLIIWSSKARGGFMELVVIGTLSLIVSIWMLTNPVEAKGGEARIPNWRFALLGFILGVGWWVNNQIIFYLCAIALTFLVHFARPKRWDAGIVAAFVGLLGFLIGGAPFWYYNLFETPRFQSIEVLTARVGFGEMFKHLVGFFTDALPIIFGARRLWEAELDVFPGATLISYVVIGTALAYIIALALKSKPTDKSSSKAQQAGLTLFIFFCAMVPIVFSKSARGWLSQEPRYLLPLYSVLFVMVGVLCSELRRSSSKAVRTFALLPCVALLGVNLSSNYLGGVTIPLQPFVFQGERVAANQDPLYKFLLDNNYHHIRTNYWIGYRTAFETSEAITFSMFRGDRVVRIPEYEGQDLGQPDMSAYVLVPGEAKVVSTQLAAQGFIFQSTNVGGYVVLTDIAPQSTLGAKIPIAADHVHTTSRQDWAHSLVDGSVQTRWGSGTPQRPGMAIEIDFDSPTAIAGLLLDSGFWPQDSARSLTIEAEDANGNSCILVAGLTEPVVTPRLLSESPNSNGNLTDQLADSNSSSDTGASAVFYFAPRKVKKLRLIDDGSDAVFDWSVAELTVFAPQ